MNRAGAGAGAATGAAELPRGALVGVLGLARSGRAAAELALARGYRVFVSDGGDSAELRAAAERVQERGGEAEVGGHTIERLAGCDVIVLSPGVPPSAQVLRDHRLAAVPRISELEFAFRALACPVIGITGTNGKSTTTALTAHVLSAAGMRAPAAGNIGRALSEVALMEPAPDWVVVECSSFQLADIATFAPRIGVVTNLSPDHLDRYPSVDAYYADKARLFENARVESTWVLGAHANVAALADDAPGRRLWVWEGEGEQEGEHGEEGEQGEEGWGGADGPPAPARSSSDGGWVADGELRVRIDGREVALVRADELQLLGRHNQANALFAALCALAAGAAAETVRKSLRTFPPLAHRLEPVAEVAGVLWINDSKATNLDSTRVALRSMTRPTVLLLGGRHKGEPYSNLLPEMRDHVRVVIGYGEAGDIVEADLRPHLAVERVDGDFGEVLERAAALARPGDAVLLSPACSSFDMFRDYEDRGDQFKQLVSRAAEVTHGA